MSEKLIPMIVFEGPDMCGKSTHIDSVVERLNKQGHKFMAYKFPVYDGFKGKEILNHLKTFDFTANTVSESLTILKNHAVNLYVNKVEALNRMLELAKTEKIEGFIVDRFDISQLIYDIAWINILYSVNKLWYCRQFTNKNMDFLLKDFYYSAVDRALSTHELYSKYFDIKYVGFSKSKIIKLCANSDTTRRHDKYDENNVYQDNISDLSDIFFHNSAKTIIDSLYDEGERNFIMDNLLKFKAKINPLFKLLTSKYPEMDKLCSDIKSNVIGNINTDSIYEMFSPFSQMADDVILNMVLNCKDNVTSKIDTVIIEDILQYLNGGTK